METALYYLALSGILTVLLWTPYILGRLFLWGLRLCTLLCAVLCGKLSPCHFESVFAHRAYG